MTTVLLPAPPPTELDPPFAGPPAGQGPPPTVVDPADIDEELPSHPQAWPDLGPGAELRSAPHSRITRFTTAQYGDVVVKAWRTRRDDLQQIWEFWENCRTNGAALVPLLDTCTENGVAFELMPYRPAGSLYDVFAAGGHQPAPRTASELEAILRQLAHTVAILHTEQADGRFAVHGDIKPANLLVESIDPLRIELSDTGSVVLVDELAPTVPGRQATAAYQAPEALTMVHPPQDYWSLGMSLAELGTGRHPYERPNRQFHSPATIRAELAQRDPEIPGGLDDRWLRLVHGLLIRDSALRFGAEEIARWLAGEPVPDAPRPQEPPVRADAPAPGNAFTFAGTTYAGPRDLAAAMAAHWADTVRLVLGRDLERLIGWAQEACPAQVVALTEVAERRRSNLVNEHRAAAELIRCLDPEAAPIFHGHRCDRDGLGALATQALHGDPEAGTIVTRLFESSALDVVSRAPQHQDLRQLAGRWQHLVGVARQLIARHIPSGQLPAAELLPAYLLSAVLSRQRSQWLAEQAASCLTPRTTNVEWFLGLASTPDDVDAAAHHAVMVLAAPQAEFEGTAVRPELDAWARAYLERTLAARAAAREQPPRRPRGRLVRLLRAFWRRWRSRR
ncbi:MULTISPECIES: protein kinase domain-containing protein [Kribbella]|uniref:Protein kinase domain-containing protein n=1 Tax=Kribbella karoonensis TaxID=324851 RepID=A0ABP4QLB9_9ACTN